MKHFEILAFVVIKKYVSQELFNISEKSVEEKMFMSRIFPDILKFTGNLKKFFESFVHLRSY